MSAGSIFEIQNKPDYTLVRFYGYLDAGIVQQIKPTLQERIPDACARLIADLSRVEFLDSHGVGFFVSLLKRVHKNKGSMIFVGAEGQPEAVLQMVGFNGDIVTYCKTVDEACARCAEKEPGQPAYLTPQP